VAEMATKATSQHLEEVGEVLSLMSNPIRLKILCLLLGREECRVSDIQAAVAIGQSPLSQHLARLRAAGFVETRKDRQNVYYRIAREDIREIMHTLYRLYCA